MSAERVHIVADGIQRFSVLRPFGRTLKQWHMFDACWERAISIIHIHEFRVLLIIRNYVQRIIKFISDRWTQIDDKNESHGIGKCMR